MPPFNVLIQAVPDPDLGPLLRKLNEAGFADPMITPTDMPAPPPSTPSGSAQAGEDLPDLWEPVRELSGQSYSWPEEEERYDPHVVYVGQTLSEGAVHIALGDAGRAKVFGRDRNYTIAFLTSGSPQTPLV